VSMTCPANVRDLGGLPLTAGGVTRSGVLLRGDAIYDGDDPPPAVPWPPRTVIDLRSSREWQTAAATWPDATRVVRHPLFDAAALDVVPAEDALLTMYDGILTTAARSVAAVAGLLATDGPALVHCAAGKDRTGVAVAALLLLAGVELEAVVADYRRTEAAMPQVLERAFARGALARSLFHPIWATAPHEAIDLVVQRLARRTEAVAPRPRRDTGGDRHLRGSAHHLSQSDF
jgi:protein-tyrosine phosphatase